MSDSDAIVIGAQLAAAPDASSGCVVELTSGRSSRQFVFLGAGPEMTKILLVASLPLACGTVTA